MRQRRLLYNNSDSLFLGYYQRVYMNRRGITKYNIAIIYVAFNYVVVVNYRGFLSL